MKTLSTSIFSDRQAQLQKSHLTIIQPAGAKVPAGTKAKAKDTVLKIERVRCPNCGSYAERHHLLDIQITRTQCGSCDYLMVMSSKSGKVIEAYAPGISELPNFCSLENVL
jgi:ribosomal protein S27AE